LYLSDLLEDEITLNVDSIFIASIFKVVINLFEMTAECSVRVDNGDWGILPAEFASFGLVVPESFRKQEVVVFQSSKGVALRNVEEGWASIVVIMDSVAFGSTSSPARVISICVKGVALVSPGIFKSLD
jgi:hypothetical protein